jgi:hypothetical protein
MEHYRLSIKRRGEIAVILWRHLLAKRRDTARLEALDDPKLAAHPRLVDHYAFESFLDEYRPRLASALASTACYNEAWVRVSLEADDRFLRTEHAISRLASALFAIDAEEGGQMRRWGEVWFEETLGWDAPVEREECFAFVAEIAHELFVELVAARVRARSQES